VVSPVNGAVRTNIFTANLVTFIDPEYSNNLVRNRFDDLPLIIDNPDSSVKGPVVIRAKTENVLNDVRATVWVSERDDVGRLGKAAISSLNDVRTHLAFEVVELFHPILDFAVTDNL